MTNTSELIDATPSAALLIESIRDIGYSLETAIAVEAVPIEVGARAAGLLADIGVGAVVAGAARHRGGDRPLGLLGRRVPAQRAAGCRACLTMARPGARRAARKRMPCPRAA